MAVFKIAKFARLVKEKRTLENSGGDNFENKQMPIRNQDQKDSMVLSFLQSPLALALFFVLSLFYPAAVSQKPPMLHEYIRAVSLFCGFSIFFLLPGYFLKKLIFPDRFTGFFETVAFSFALNLLVLCAVTIPVFEFGLNVGGAYTILSVVTGALIVAMLVQIKKRDRTFSSIFEVTETFHPGNIVLAILTIVLIVFFYFQGGFCFGEVPRGEEMLHLGIVRKLLLNPEIRFDNIYYRPEATTPYLYAPYHLALALVAFWSTFDPIVIYDKFRMFSALIGVSVSYTLVRVFWKNKAVAFWGVILIGFSHLTGVWENLMPHYWSPFVPFAYPTDVAAGIILPAVFIFVYLALTSNQKDSLRYLILSALFIFVIAAIHTREAYYLLLYLFLIALSLFITGLHANRAEILKRCGWIIGGAALLGVLFYLRRAFVSSGFMESEGFRRYTEFRELRALFKDFDLNPLSQNRMGDFMGQIENLFRPWFILPICGAPFLLLRKKSFQNTVIFALVFLPVFIFRMPILRTLVTAFSYSEIFMIMPRMLVLGSFLFWVFFIGKIAKSSGKSFGIRSLSYILFAVLPFILSRVSYWARQHFDMLIGGVILLAAVCWLIQKRVNVPELNAAEGDFTPETGRVRTRLTGVCFIFLLCLASLSGSANRNNRESLSPFPASFQDWYTHSILEKEFPYEMTEFIQKEIAPLKTFYYDFSYSYTLPMMVNQYTLSAGYIIQEESLFVRDYLKLIGDKTLEYGGQEETEEKVKRYNSLFDRHIQITKTTRPVFNPDASEQSIDLFLSGMKVDYVIIHPKSYIFLSSILQKKSNKYKNVYDKNSYAIYEVLGDHA